MAVARRDGWVVGWVGGWVGGGEGGLGGEMSRADVGAELKTGCERCKERRGRLPGMEFGEAVLWKRRREGGTLGQLSGMWKDGIE